MATDFKARAREAWEALTPRARQWGALGGISLAAIVILWLAFSTGEGGKKPAGPSAPKTDLKPTNVDIAAPGSQISEVETWVGKAGKDMEQWRHDREEQSRINRDTDAKSAEMLRRLGELEAKLKSGSPTSATQPSAPPSGPVPAPPPAPVPPAPQPARFPPDGQMPTGGLPPPPPAPMPRVGMPAGVPTFNEPPPVPQLVRVSLAQSSAAASGASSGKVERPRSVNNFLPVSIHRGLLLGGVDASTGGQAQSDPQPILIRLEADGILPNRHRGKYRECFVVAAAYGELSSERAKARTELLSCIRKDGQSLEVPIQGTIFGDDGKVGIRGTVVTKQGQMLSNALLAGTVSGLGQGFATANTTVNSSALGTVTTTSGADAYRAGLGAGVGKALDRLAQYYIKLAEATFPVIQVDAGRAVDVVLTKGVEIPEEDYGPANETALSRAHPADRYSETPDESN